MGKKIKIAGDRSIQNIKINNEQPSIIDKNLENFTKITSIEDENVYLNLIKSTKIKVILQEDTNNSSKNWNNILSSSIFLNLINRFLDNIKFQGNLDPIKKVFPTQSFIDEIKLKDFQEEANLTVVFGNKEILENRAYYVSSSGWSIYLSKLKPCQWKNFVVNPLSAFYVGTLMVGEVFKNLLKNFVKVDLLDEYIYDFVHYGKIEQPVLCPSLPNYIDLNLTIIGCGAVGQAIGMALKKLDLRGKITFIDKEIIDISNLQRYPLAFKENIGVSKTELVSWYIAYDCNLLLTSFNINTEYRIAINEGIVNYQMEDVFISVDNKQARLDLQAALPKMIWNVWTDTNENSLRYGFGKHDFKDPYECLACAYYPDENIPKQMELNSKLLGIDEKTIEKRIQNNDLFKENDLNYLFENFTVPQNQVNNLKLLIGKPFKDALHGECGVFNVKLSEKHEPTPAPHVPTLAGITAVIQYILSKIDPECSKNIHIGEYDAFSYPNENCLLKKKKNTNCVCNDEIYQEVFREKWN